MAIINFYTRKDESEQYDLEVINFDGNAVAWLLKNIEAGENFSVYEGELSKEHEISRDYEKIFNADKVSVFLLPAGGIAIGFVIAAVLTVVALNIKPAALPNVNRAQQSPNNSLSDRNNKPRPNQRIVDVCGRIKSIPDVLSREYSRFVDDVEQRIGYYCVARNNLLIEDVKEGDTLISDIIGSSAGVYGAFKSPNDSVPDIQIGDVINEPVYNVTQSHDAIGQTLNASNVNVLDLGTAYNAFPSGYLEKAPDSTDLTDHFKAGDYVNLIDLIILTGVPVQSRIGEDTHIILSVEENKIVFDISNDNTWALASGSGSQLQDPPTPKIEGVIDVLVGPFKMLAVKSNRLLVNVNALNGVYKEDVNGRVLSKVTYRVTWQKLDDLGVPIGLPVDIEETISGRDGSEKGLTTDIDLGADTFVQWSVERLTLIDHSFNGNIVDEIKIKSVFGLGNIDEGNFGNVTTIQTKRANRFLTTSTKTPELNCIATELVQKYEGSGVFNPAFTPNTQAMQTLIRLALDPFIGRRVEAELDLDLLLSIQNECETYFGESSAGQFNYSFDSSSLSAQETFLSISKAAFITLWREGRVLKGWFESPQSVPSMVFTHRSKQSNAEVWNRKRNSSDSKDSIEFTYTDAKTFRKETLFFPEDQSGTNPERVEFTGVTGEQQAFWQMMRLFNKQKYQEITVDFGATQEGRFVKPNRLISVVKGSRVYTYDGYIVAVNGLDLTLSQEVEFVPDDAHSIILKSRNGSTESITVLETPVKNVVKLLSLPAETIYTGNSALKTEFSLGSESRLSGQLMMPTEIAPDGKQYVKIKAVNYSPLYYSSDKVLL